MTQPQHNRFIPGIEMELEERITASHVLPAPSQPSLVHVLDTSASAVAQAANIVQPGKQSDVVIISPNAPVAQNLFADTPEKSPDGGILDIQDDTGDSIDGLLFPHSPMTGKPRKFKPVIVSGPQRLTHTR